MADNNIFVYNFRWNKKWREKCGTFFLFLFRSKSFFVRNISLEKWAVESALKSISIFLKKKTTKHKGYNTSTVKDFSLKSLSVHRVTSWNGACSQYNFWIVS